MGFSYGPLMRLYGTNGSPRKIPFPNTSCVTASITTKTDDQVMTVRLRVTTFGVAARSAAMMKSNRYSSHLLTNPFTLNHGWLLTMIDSAQTPRYAPTASATERGEREAQMVVPREVGASRATSQPTNRTPNMISIAALENGNKKSST